MHVRIENKSRLVRIQKMAFDCYAQSDCVQQMEFYKPTLQARYIGASATNV